MWPFKKKKKTYQLTYKDFCILYPLCSDESRERLAKVVQSQKRPDDICGYPVPKDLNGLTYGQLDDIQSTKDVEKLPETIASVILGLPKEILGTEEAEKVFGFINFVTSELNRINKLFESIQVKHSPEEIRAGVENLNFGTFGVLDWYAKRQGITNQNDVRDVAWVRIFICMKMDNEKAEFEKRLREVYQKSKKPRKK